MNLSNRSSFYRITRALFTLGMVFVLAIMGGVASAHNLQTKMVYMFFDPDTQACIDARIEGVDLPVQCQGLPQAPYISGDPILMVGDELGIIVKVIPRDGTDTGVGGHIDFYIPLGTEVLDVAYLLPGDSNPNDGISGYDKVPMKGQSLIAVGDGPVGAKSTAELDGLCDAPATDYGPNIIGAVECPVGPGGLHRGTVSGLYGDTGIFYSTDPDTSYGSWARHTGHSDLLSCGTENDDLPGAIVGTRIVNNSGDIFVPCNKWDAEQMFAWGVKGGTCKDASNNPIDGCTTTPIVDYGDGRGNAPWGFGSGVAGQESGYAWHFNWEDWRDGGKNGTAMQSAMGNEDIGPWKRIQYTGSRISSDQPGLVSTDLGITSVDAGDYGRLVSPNTPLPEAGEWNSNTPNVIRWAVGQLTTLVPEYAWVKIKVNDVSAILNEDGCPVFFGDTFGGDAGGTDNGKDHLWRYYEPSRITWNACMAIGKPSESVVVKPGDLFQYKVKFYNLAIEVDENGNPVIKNNGPDGDPGTADDILTPATLTNVTITDTLPSGVQFVSAFPSQNIGPNPLIWTVSELLPNEFFEALVTVKATGSGPIQNTVCVVSDQFPEPNCSVEIVTSGNIPVLKQNKTASVAAVAPGGSFEYTIEVENIGSGASGNPLVIEERLEDGITFSGLQSVLVNGADYTGSTSANAGAEGPIFNVPASIAPGMKLLLTFSVDVDETAEPGTYCNSLTTYQGGSPLSTGSLACVEVGGGKIGGNIFHDWLGDGDKDFGDSGVTGVTVQLLDCGADGICGNTDDGGTKTVTADADGNYLFEGLAPAPEGSGGTNYQITVLDGSGSPLEFFSQTVEPSASGPVDCRTGQVGDPCANVYVVNLTQEADEDLDNDFGYKPGGSGSIGDQVFEGSSLTDTVFDFGTDPVISGVTVKLYADTNGNGVVDPGEQEIASDVTDVDGLYSFDNLAEGYDYVVVIDPADSALSTHFSPNAGVTTSSNSKAVSNLSGAYDQADFGYFEVTTSTLSGTAFADENANGSLEIETDDPLEGITVWLCSGSVSECDGDNAIQTTTTGPNGFYEFTGLAGGGNFTVGVDETGAPPGYAPSTDNTVVFVPLSQNVYDVDFPFVQLLTKSVENLALPTPNDGATGSPTDTLEYTVNPGYTGSELLTNVTVTDSVPTGSTFVAAPLAGSSELAVDGVDPGSGACSLTLDDSNADDFDSYIESGKSGDNFGIAAELKAKNSADKRALIQYDIASCNIPASASVTDASLNLRFNDRKGPTTLQVYRLTTGWTEAGVTWDDYDGTSAWTTAGGDFDATLLGSLSIPGDNTTDEDLAVPLVSAGFTAIENWVDGTWPNYGFMIRTDAAEEQKIASEESANPPQLDITYTSAATTNSLAVSPTLLATGGDLTVTMTLTSDTALTGVTASIAPATPLSGSPAASCGASTPASQPIGAGGSVTFSWTCSTSGTGEFQFTGNASGTLASDTYNFFPSKSNSTELVASAGSLTWNLGSNTAGVPGSVSAGSTINQWAANVVGFSSECGGCGGYDAAEALGLPDVTICGDNANAWTPGDGTVDQEYLWLGYTIPVYATGVRVHEVGERESTVGFVTGVILVEPDGTEHRVYNSVNNIPAGTDAADSLLESPQADPPNECPGWFELTFPTTPYLVDEVRIETVTPDSGWWENIDAVELVGYDSPPLATTTTLTTDRTLVGDNQTFNVTMTLATTTAGTVSITNVVADSTLGITGTNGFTATCGSASLSPSTDTTITSSTDPVVYTYSCTSDTDGITALPAQLTFTGGATSTEASFADATSNSVLASPPLTFQVSVDNPASVSTVDNQASMQSDDGIPSTLSNLVQTELGSRVGDTVWEDWNQDGVKDEGEEGIDGVVLELRDGVCVPGSNCPTTTTSGGGLYSFEGLGAGDYTVAVISGVPADYQQTYDLDGTGTPEAATFTLGATEVKDDVDFGYQPVDTSTGATVGDQVYIDVGGDGGDYVPGTDIPLSGVTVNLYRDIDGTPGLSAGDLLYATTTTDGSGKYLFDDLPAGDWVVEVDGSTVPTGYSTADYALGTNLSANETDLTVDFPFVEVPPLLAKSVFNEDGPVSNTGDFATVGDTLTYTLEPNYAGNDQLTNVTVTDEVPAGTTYVGVPGANAGGSESGGTVTWDLGSTTLADDGIAIFSPDFVGARKLSNIHLTSWVIARPDGTGNPVQAGDLMITAITWEFKHGTNAAIDAVPSGWLQLGSTTSTGTTPDVDLAQAIYYKVATGSEPATYTWGTNLGVHLSMGSVAYRGVDTTASPPVDAFSNPASTDNGTTVVAPEITTTTENALLLAIWSSQDNAGLDGAAATPPGSMTERVDAYIEGSSDDLGVALADEVFANPGATGTRTATFVGTGAQNIGFMLALELTGTYSGVNNLSADHSLAVDGETITFTQTITLDQAVNDITVDNFSPLSACANTPTATLLSGGGTDDDLDGTPGDSVVYEWTCAAQAGVNPANIQFSATASGTLVSDSSTVNWSAGTANGVIITPPLTFQVTVDGGVDPIENTGHIADTGGTLDFDSNTVYTALSASIGDRVWSDTGNFGTEDAGEFGISGVTVNLYDNTGALVGTAVTDANGYYLFTGLTAGVEYTVEVDTITVPAGSLATTPTSVSHTLIAGEQYRDADFGFRPPNTTDPASLGDTVFLDQNENGDQDAGEPGIAGVQVNLYIDENNDGVLDAGDSLLTSTVTDANGNYLFEGLYPDNYVVEVVPPPGTEPVSAPDKGSIGDTVWLDSDGDGIKDPDEPGLAKVVVYIDENDNGILDWADGNGNGTWDPGEGERWDHTDADGTYIFDDLDAGSYDVKIDSSSLPGSLTLTTAPTVPIVLATGERRDDVDFGYQPAAGTAVIGDFIWSDADGDGIQDEGEVGINDVTVNLYTAGPDGILGTADDVLFDSADTDSGGFYLFTNVPATGSEDYRIEVVSYSDPDGTPNNGDETSPGLDGFNSTPTNNGGALFYDLTDLNSGDVIDTADWGFEDDGTGNHVGSIGDTIYKDLNGNGTQDPGEPGIAGVTVDLHSASGKFLGSVTTDDNGNYSFDGLLVSDGGEGYIVEVTDHADLLKGLIQTEDPDETGICSVCDDQTTTAVTLTTTAPTKDDVDFGYIYPVTQSETLDPGEENLGIDFPLNYIGQIGDTTFYDTNANGVQDPGEQPAPNVTMLLIEDANGNGKFDVGETVLDIQFTDIDGSYLFDNLPPGDYVVQADEQTVENPDTGQYSTMVETTGGDYATTLAPGSMQDLDADFGFIEGAEVEGHVFHDVNHNGLLDGTEPRIENVKVWLDDGNGVLDWTDGNENGTWDPGEGEEWVYTDANGEYKFIVAPGDYTITYDSNDIPAELSEETTPTSVTFNAVAGVEYGGANFDFGVDNAGVIGDRIWNDANGNGIQDTGEAGIAGVTVRLYASDGTTLLATQATDAFGNYEFPGLEDATYVVEVDSSNFNTSAPLDGLTQTGDPDDSLPPCGNVSGTGDTCDNKGTAVISGGNTVDTIDFGYQLQGVTTYPVSGNIWDDNGDDGGTAGDGISNGAEPPLAGVTVTIEVDDDNDGIIDDTYTVYTDANGDYSLSGVIPAGSDVTITVDTSTLGSTAYLQTGDPDETGTCTTSCDSTTTITGLTGTNGDNQDFGYKKTLGSLAGTVCDGNGDGECGDIAVIGGALDLDGDGFITTADDGSYGGYLVIDGFIDIDGDRSITAADNGTVNGLAVTAGSLPGGTTTAPETVLSGVTVILTGAGQDGILGTDDDTVVTATTDSNGDYSFGGLEPNIYQVTKITPDGYSNLADADGGNPNNITVFLGSGEVLTDQDFEVESQVGAIGDFVWHDVDGDGVQDIGEPGLSNVTVNLYEDTDGDGQFEPSLKVVGGLVDANGDGTIDFEDDNYGLIIDNGTTDVAVDVIDGYVYVGGTNTLYTGDLNGYPVAGGVIDFDGGADTGTVAGDDGLPVSTKVTDINGNYLFTNAAAGPYFVDVIDGTLPVGLELSPGGADALLFTLGAGESFLDADFGYNNADTATASIGDTVWADYDPDGPSGPLLPNGMQDPGEAGLEGITVTIWYDSDDDGLIDAIYTGAVDQNGVTGTGTTTTEADGTYLFTSLPPGDYEVVIGVPAGYTVSDGPQSPGSDTSVPITVTADETYLNADFGLVNNDLYTITDTLWYDDNGDGFKEAGESGIPGVTVNLLNDAGEIIATAITDEQGEFVFSGLTNGDYTIQVADTSGQLDGLGGTTPGGVYGELDVNISGGDYSGVDFGYNRRGAIGDTVFSDFDANGIQDAGEPGISGVTVDLWYDVDGNGEFDSTVDTLVGTTTTVAGGNYLFTDLVDGTYFASVNESGQAPLSDYTLTTNDDETGVNAAGTQIEVVIDGAGGGELINLDADFGYQNTSLADVSGNVFEDFDADGVDDGVVDPGIAGVTIELVDPGADGFIGANPGADGLLGTFDDLPSDDTVVATTTTDANGDYIFTGVAGSLATPINYAVVVADDADILDGYFLTSGLDAIEITVAGDDITNIDFGYIRESGTASIGDTVWLDSDNDHVLDPDESGISGVTIQLWDTGADGVIGGTGVNADTLIATVATDTNGQYSFDGLDPGNYYTVVTDTGSKLTGLEPSTTSTPAIASESTVINLSDGEDYLTADYGYSPVGTDLAVGDLVWYDADGNGLQDDGEIGIGGVTVYICLRDVICDEFTNNLGAVVTAPDGSYLITGLPSGLADYTVYVVDGVGTPLEGYSATAGSSSAFDITLENSDILYADFHYGGGTTATIGDTVYQDLGSGNTLGLANVTVDLLNFSGDVIATTVTDSNGNYSFAGLPDGSYTVNVTDLNGVLSTLNASVDPDGTADGTTTLVVGGGSVTTLGGSACTACDLNVDFGYAGSAGTGTIGDLVWHDINSDGIYDAGESGFEGVTLGLWLDVDGDGVIDPGTDNFLRTTTTDVNGNYAFTGLPPASYIVELVDTAGVLDVNLNGVIDGDEWEITYNLDGLDGDTNEHTAAVTLTTANPDNFDVDFGLNAVTDYSVAGTVFNDANVNGGNDCVDPDDPQNCTEPGVPGATVLLYRVLDDGSTALVGTTVTDSKGEYLFGDLPAGDYRVVVDPSGTTVEGIPATTPGSLDVTVNATTDAADGVTDGIVSDNDFGFGIQPTYVSILNFSAYKDTDVVVRWETSIEVGTMGFHLERYDAATDSWQRLNDELLPSLLGAPSGAVYYFVDPTARNGKTYTYRLIEIDNVGLEMTYGPFEVKVTGQGKKLDKNFDANEREPDPLTVSRFDAAAKANSGKGGGKPTKPPKETADAIKVLVQEDGLYSVPAQAIADGLGESLTSVEDWIRNNQLLVSHRDQRVAALGSADSSALLFYGESIDSIYTDDNVYWIRKQGGDAMPVVSGGDTAAAVDPGDYPYVSKAEQDLTFPMTFIGGDPELDYYFWNLLWISGSDKTVVSPVAMPVPSKGAVIDSGATACLTAYVKGYNNDPAQQKDHQVRLQVNDVEVGDWDEFDGIAHYDFTACFGQDLLNDGDNDVRMVGRTSDGVLLNVILTDRFELSYRRHYQASDDRIWVSGDGNNVITVDGFSDADIEVFDLADPMQPKSVNGLTIEANGLGYRVSFEPSAPDTSYLVQTSTSRLTPLALIPTESNKLRESNNRAAHVVIAPRSLEEGAQALADYRSSTGLKSQLVILEDIYDSFNGGIVNPYAIQDFLGYAAANWKQAPLYAALVGKGSLDHRNVQKKGGNLLPVLMVNTPYGMYACDSCYGDLDSDGVSEIAIGRIPVLSAEELVGDDGNGGYVAKLANYEAMASVYASDLLFSADNPDVAGNFTLDSDNLASLIPGEYNVSKAYIVSDPITPPKIGTPASVSAVKAALLDAFGTKGLVNWVGHGSYPSLADEKVMLIADVGGMNNADDLPLFAALTCSAGRFEVPGDQALSEALLLREGGGAIAAYSPTGLSINDDAVQLNEGLLRSLYQDGQLRIGDAAIDTQQFYKTQSNPVRFMLDIYGVMGDPATILY